MHSGLDFSFVPGATPKKPVLRVDRPTGGRPDQCASKRCRRRRSKPCSPSLCSPPAGSAWPGWSCARGRECSGDIFHFALRVLEAEDQHMLCHPAFGLALVGSDAQCKALLTQQHVPAVTGVHGDDGVVLREVADMSASLHRCCTCSAGRAPSRCCRRERPKPSRLRGS